MAIFNKDEVKGKYEKGKGWVKDKAGEVTGDRQLEAEGEADRAEGNVREGWGKFKRGVAETLDDISDRVNR